MCVCAQLASPQKVRHICSFGRWSTWFKLRRYAGCTNTELYTEIILVRVYKHTNESVRVVERTSVTDVCIVKESLVCLREITQIPKLPPYFFLELDDFAAILNDLPHRLIAKAVHFVNLLSEPRRKSIADHEQHGTWRAAIGRRTLFGLPVSAT